MTSSDDRLLGILTGFLNSCDLLDDTVQHLPSSPSQRQALRYIAQTYQQVQQLMAHLRALGLLPAE